MFTTRKIAMLLALVLMLSVGMSILGTVHTEAIWDSSYINITSNVIIIPDYFPEYVEPPLTLGKIMEKHNVIITVVSGLVTVIMAAIFILNFMNLGSCDMNPTERQKVRVTTIWSGIAAALFGSVTLIVGVFYGMLK